MSKQVFWSEGDLMELWDILESTGTPLALEKVAIARKSLWDHYDRLQPYFDKERERWRKINEKPLWYRLWFA